MKTVKLFGKYDRLKLTPEEFEEFMEGKTCYHHICNWLEMWTFTDYKYAPYKNVILPNDNLLIHHTHYKDSPRCRDSMTASGKELWECHHWKATAVPGGILIEEVKARKVN